MVMVQIICRSRDYVYLHGQGDLTP